MNPTTQLLCLIVLAYFIGSIPFGLIVGLVNGIDPRKSGSGNIGATNVGRLLGGKFFALVFILDLLKSLVPMLAAGWLVGRMQINITTYILWLLVGFASVIGHMFPIYLQFKGGKGVATSAGMLLGLWPFYTLPGLIALIVFLVAFYAKRYISLGSILSAVSFPLAYVIIAVAESWDPFGIQLPLLICSVLIAGLIVYKHRGNISRLRAGTEMKMVKKTMPSRVHPTQSL